MRPWWCAVDVPMVQVMSHLISYAEGQELVNEVPVDSAGLSDRFRGLRLLSDMWSETAMCHWMSMVWEEALRQWSRSWRDPPSWPMAVRRSPRTAPPRTFTLVEWKPGSGFRTAASVQSKWRLGAGDHMADLLTLA